MFLTYGLKTNPVNETYNDLSNDPWLFERFKKVS